MTEQQQPPAPEGAPAPSAAAPGLPPIPAPPSLGGHGGGPRGGMVRRRRDFKGKYMPRRKVCAFCADKSVPIDYKDVPRMRRFLSDRGKIEPRRKTGTCAKHQRTLTTALKRARFIALLPYTAEHIRLMGGPPPGRGSEYRERRDFDRGGDRGGYRGGDGGGERPVERPVERKE